MLYRHVLPFLVGGATGMASLSAAEPAGFFSSGPHPGQATLLLFSSEGCSSCPPADDFAAALDKEARAKSLPIRVLVFHVDIWDTLHIPGKFAAWVDPYGSATNSRLQSRIIRAGNAHVDAKSRLRGLLTPMFAVNGRYTVVKKSEDVVNAIKTSLAIATTATLAITPLPGPGYGVRWSVGQVPQDGEILVALTQRGITQAVDRGENAGKTLAHHQLVRGFRAASAAAFSSGQTTIPFAGVVDPAQGSLVAYVWSPSQARILVSTEIPLPARAQVFSPTCTGGVCVPEATLP